MRKNSGGAAPQDKTRLARMPYGWLLAVVSCVGLSSPALASDILGTALLDGRKVEILADGTWVYAEALPDDCQVLTSDYMLCAETGKWTKTLEANSDITAQFRFSDTAYSLVVIEEVGSNQGVNQQGMRETVLDNAAAIVGFDTNKVLVIDVSDARLLDEDAETVTYFMEVDGLPVVYRNTILIRPGTTIQAMTYEISKDLTDDHAALHAEFLEELSPRE